MKKLYLFALFLVLYEFSTYASNDMIMPGMLQVVHDFNEPITYVSMSISAYVFGNCILQLFLGPLAERFGKRQVILYGNIFFIVVTIFIIFSQSITQFMLGRFIQGGGLAFIAIGYALIHENFDDKSAVKIFSLMANVSLLAPLLGPLIGTIVIALFNWRYTFVLTAIISLCSLIGLYYYTPSSTTKKHSIDLAYVTNNYIKIFTNSRVMLGSSITCIASLPILCWIALAPTIIMKTLHFSMFYFGIFQLVSIGGLFVSSIVMQIIAGKISFYKLITHGAFLGFLALTLGFIFDNNVYVVLLGMFVYSFSLGIFNTLIVRLIMTVKDLPQSMITSVMVFIQTLGFALGIELANMICEKYGYTLHIFSLINLFLAFCFLVMIFYYAKGYKEKLWD